MKQSQQQGFSLIEVMIIFVVMAVIMAASMPLITGKSKSPYDGGGGDDHGVYECMPVRNADGTISFESKVYKYKSNGELDNGHVINAESGATCTFKDIPQNVKRFKVDLYSAGAGGTNYADIKVETLDTPITRTITLGDLPDIINGSGPNSQKYGLTPGQIVNFFAGRRVRRSLYTADGGDGASAEFTYNSPADAVCTAVFSQALPTNGDMNLNDLLSIKYSLTLYNALQPIYSRLQQLGAGNSSTDHYKTGYEDLVQMIGSVDGTIPPYTYYGLIQIPAYADLQAKLDYTKSLDPTTQVTQLRNTYKEMEQDVDKIRKNVLNDIPENYRNKKAEDVDKEIKELEKTGDDIQLGMLEKIYRNGAIGPQAKAPNGLPQVGTKRTLFYYDGGGQVFGEKLSRDADGFNFLLPRDTLTGKTIYEGRYDLMFPQDNGGGIIDSRLVKQLNEYCEAMYPEYYLASGSEIKNGTIVDGETTANSIPVGMNSNARRKVEPVKDESDSITGYQSLWWNASNNNYDKNGSRAFRENYFVLKPHYVSNDGRTSVVKQQGGKGGKGGAIVMEYTLPNVAPDRYNFRWVSCPGIGCHCANVDNNNDYNTLAYYSDLYRMNDSTLRRDACGAPYENNRNPVNYTNGLANIFIAETASSLTGGVNNDNAPALQHSDDISFYYQAGDGGDVSGTDVNYPSFNVPQIETDTCPSGAGGDCPFSVTGRYKTNEKNIIQSVATGGKGGLVGYKKAVRDFPFNKDDMINDIWHVWWGEQNAEEIVRFRASDNNYNTIAKRYPKARDGEPGMYSNPIDTYPIEYQEKQDTTFEYIRVRSTNPAPNANITGHETANFRFGGSMNTQFEEPRIIVENDNNDVSYKLGGAGGKGQHETYTAFGLGNKCQINVSGGGQPLNVKSTDTDINVLVNNYRNISNSLATSISCTNSEGDTVFSKRLAGGEYNFAALLGAAFMTEPNMEEPENATDESFFHRFTTNIATYITQWWQSKNDNDLRDSIASGGHGIMVPICTARGVRGGRAAVYRYFGGSPETLEKGERIGAIINNADIRIDGESSETECEQLVGSVNHVKQDASRSFVNYYQFRTDFGNITNNEPNGDNSKVYGAASGGPGAVIITW